MRRALPLVPPLLLLAAAAPAPPLVQPSRDVVGTYVVEGQATSLVPGGIPGPVRLSWDAAGQRLRVEVTGRNQVALIDLKAHSGQAIDPGLRVVLPLPVRASDLQPLTLEGARLTRTGRDVVAGLACTVYAVDGGGRPGTVCLTPDGVPLRGQGEFNGKPGTFRATAISYGALPPALFTVPSGYITLNGSGGGGLGGAIGSALGGGGAGGLDLRSLGRSLLGGGK